MEGGKDKMIRTLIVDDNLEYVKKILNNTINSFKEICVQFIATTAKEAIDILSNNRIDLVFLDLNLPDKDGIYIIEKIELLNIMKNPHIVIISEDIKLIEKVNSKHITFDIISKFEEQDSIYNKIKKIVHEINYIENEKEIKDFIISELSNIGYNWKYKGTLYIFECILYIYRCNNMDLLDNLEKNVYKYVSYKNRKRIDNIKTNIIKATNAIKSENNLTPKFVVSTVLTKMVINF